MTPPSLGLNFPPCTTNPPRPHPTSITSHWIFDLLEYSDPSHNLRSSLALNSASTFLTSLFHRRFLF